jgi:hypothetical protein
MGLVIKPPMPELAGWQGRALLDDVTALASQIVTQYKEFLRVDKARRRNALRHSRAAGRAPKAASQNTAQAAGKSVLHLGIASTAALSQRRV